jgi:hypothetical protein
MWCSTTFCQLFEELVPIGNVDCVGLLEQCEQSLRNCCVLVVPLKIRAGLALNVDVPLSALNAAFGFLDVSLQEGSLHPDILPAGSQRWTAGNFLLDRRLIDRSPLRLKMHDNRNNHRAETEVGLCLMGQPSRRWNAVSYWAVALIGDL